MPYAVASILVLLLSSAISSAQNPDRIDEILLHNLLGVDDATVMGSEMVGYNSVSLMVSTNNGLSWRRRNYPDSLHYVAGALDGDSVFYVMAKREWDEYSDIELFKSTDNGHTYTLVDTVLPKGWSAGLAVYDDRMLAFGGNAVYESFDRGLTWTLIRMAAPQTSVVGRAFLNRETILICSMDNKVYRTTNHGTTWNSVPFSMPSYAYTFRQWDSSTVMVGMGDSKYYLSYDLGTSWTQLQFAFEGETPKGQVSRVNKIGSLVLIEVLDPGSPSQRFYSVGERPFKLLDLARCNDFSSTIRVQPVADYLFIFNAATLQRFRVGDSLTFDGYVTMQDYTSVNAAGAWDCNTFGAVDYKANGYVTWNGAESWCSLWLGCGANYRDIAWTNDTTMWIAGMREYGICSEGCLQKWDPTTGWFRIIEREPEFLPLIAMEWLDEQNGWLLSNSDIAYKTTDGGTTWNSIDISARSFSFSTMDLVIGDNGDIWCAGLSSVARGLISVSHDGGTTFEADTLFDGFVVTDLTAVGDGGLIAAGYEVLGTESKILYRHPALGGWVERASFPGTDVIASVAYNPIIDSVCILVDRTLYIGDSKVASLRPVTLPSKHIYLGVHSDACTGFLINLEGGAMERYSPASQLRVSVEEQRSDRFQPSSAVPLPPFTIKRFDVLGREVGSAHTGACFEITIGSNGVLAYRRIMVTE